MSLSYLYRENPNKTLQFRNGFTKIQGMLDRLIKEKVQATLKRVPAVALLGARQVGKTTLAHQIGRTCNSVYLDLESPDDLLKLRDPLSFLSEQSDKLVILDEIQHAPDLFKVLRGLIDKNRQAGRKGEQFLLLGSASMDLLRQSSESLAGRIHYIEMGVLNLLEVPHDKPKDIQKLWLRGGFPDSYLESSDAASMEWLEMLIRTYLERDVPQIGFPVPASRLRRLWTMLAHLQGETVNCSKLAGNLDVDSKTVARYLDLLVDLLLVRRLEPWHKNAKKRLIKSPRFYVRDTGILHRLLGIADHDGLLSNPVLGKSWEGFAVENLLSVLPVGVEPYYYRASGGAEADLVLRISGKDLWAVEIKHGIAPRIRYGFHHAAEDIGANRKFVVYGGKDEFPIEKDTVMVPLPALMEKLRDLETG